MRMTCMNRVFMKYCVFSKDFEIFRTLTFLCFSWCQCLYTHQAGRKPALQQYWQSSEKSQNFKEKAQYLMNTLYVCRRRLFYEYFFCFCSCLSFSKLSVAGQKAKLLRAAAGQVDFNFNFGPQWWRRRRSLQGQGRPGRGCESGQKGALASAAAPSSLSPARHYGLTDA